MEGSSQDGQNSTLHLGGNANAKINKGVFNSNRTDYVWDGVIQQSGAGTITIGNIGDNNDNIIINSNNANICGIEQASNNSTIIINSGTIKGYNGINLEGNNTNLYLNGGIIMGIGKAGENWSCGVNWKISSTKIYLKKNSNITLIGLGKTGKQSMNTTKYVIEVDKKI